MDEEVLTEKVRKVRNIIHGAIVGIALSSVALAGSLGYLVYKQTVEDQKRSVVYDKVSQASDIECNQITDLNEWSRVYTTLGRRFDYYTSDPRRDFSRKDLEDYLRIREVTDLSVLCTK